MTPYNRLSDSTVETVKARLRRGDWTHMAIAKDLGVSRHTVDRIARVHGLGRQQVRQPRPALPERTGSLEWMDKGACIDIGLDEFDEMVVGAKKRVCREKCPAWVLPECREYGLTGPIADGEVFGGLGPKQLRAIQRERAGVAS